MNREFRHSELALLRLFKRAQLHPGQRFYERMAGAPWAAASSPGGARLSLLRALAATTFVTVVALLLAFPFRSLAQQVFHFFTKAETDTVEQAAMLEPTFNPPALADLADLERASAVAGFAIRLPQDLPAGMQITTTGINPGSVSITYSDGQATLVFWQSNAEGSLFYVGAGAEVETVSVDGVAGEYVHGSWQQVGDGLVWDNTAPASLLFWEKERIRYGLLAETGEIAKETLIRIADSLP